MPAWQLILALRHVQIPSPGGHLRGERNGNCAVPVVVEGGGEGVVAHVGLHALGSFADRLGVGDSLSEKIAWTGERAPVHDRGKVLVQAMLMLAGGGEACTEIEHLRSQATLFGSVTGASRSSPDRPPSPPASCRPGN